MQISPGCTLTQLNRWQEAARRETLRAAAAHEAREFVQLMRHQTDLERYAEEQRSGSTRLLGEAELEHARWIDSQRAGRRSARRAERAAVEVGDRRRYSDESAESSDGWVTDESDETDSGYPRREPRGDGSRSSPHRREHHLKDTRGSRARRRPEAWEESVSSHGRDTDEAASAASLQRELGGLKLLALHSLALQDGGKPPCLSDIYRLCLVAFCQLSVLGVLAAVSEAAVEEAMEADAPKPALIALVLDHHAAAAAASRHQRPGSRHKVGARRRSKTRTARPPGSNRRRHRSEAAPGRGGSPVNAHSRTPEPESRCRQQKSKSPASLGHALAATLCVLATTFIAIPRYYIARSLEAALLCNRSGLASNSSEVNRQTHYRQPKPSGPESEPTNSRLLGSGDIAGGASAPVQESARESARVFLGDEW